MSRNIKIYIIAGEASGDLHGAALVNRFNELNPQIIVRGWGGDQLQAAGTQIDIRYEKTNFMGFSEVLKNLGKILGLFRTTKKILLDWKPDCLILIDYPGFNLRMAAWAFAHKIPVYYYIAPQVWAWKESRIKILKKYKRSTKKEKYNQYLREADSIRFSNQKMLDSLLATLNVKVPVEVKPKDYIEIYVSGGGLTGGLNSKTYDRTIFYPNGLIQREYHSKLGGVVKYEKKISKEELTQLAQFIVDLGFFDFDDEYECAKDDVACKYRMTQNPSPIP